MARGFGRRGFGSRSNNFDARYSFDIFTLREDGVTPTTFEGAIENFDATFEDIGIDEFAFNDGLSPILGGDNINSDTVVDIRVSGLQLDLDARLFPQGSEITNFDGEEISLSDGDLEFFDNSNGTESTRIEYKIGDGFSNDNGELTEFIIFIEDEDGDISNGFQAGEQLQLIDTNLAISDIDYIVENNLFGLASGIRIVGQNDDSNEIVYTESFADNVDSNDIDPDAADDSAITEIKTAISIDVLANDNVGIIDSFDTNSSQGGTIELDDNNTPEDPDDDKLLFTPDTDFVGSDSFSYILSNGEATSTGTVTIEVSEAEEDNEENVVRTQGTNRADVLSGSDLSDRIFGRAGHDSINGGAGDDAIHGGKGRDTIIGGAGSDLLFGNRGRDVFEFDVADFASGEVDTVGDFHVAIDTIVITGLGDHAVTFDSENSSILIDGHRAINITPPHDNLRDPRIEVNGDGSYEII